MLHFSRDSSASAKQYPWEIEREKEMYDWYKNYENE